MPLPPLASLESLASRLGLSFDEHMDSPEALRAEANLEDASALIRAEAGLDWVDDHDELLAVPAIVEAICLAVAYRAYRNPDGATQTSVGDVSVSFSRGGMGGSLYLTAEERRAIRKVAGVSAYGAITLETPFMNGAQVLYAPADGGGDMIPLGPVPWEVV